MPRKFSILINEKRCKQCGICAALCPKCVLVQELGMVPYVKNKNDCIGCSLCEMRCPDFAIKVEKENG